MRVTRWPLSCQALLSLTPLPGTLLVIRRFNEENNQEAGALHSARMVQLIANLAFTPARSGTYLVYGGTCGTGGC